MASAERIGWFGNHRELEEQMLGLSPALWVCRGRRVLDVGSAEGLIGVEFARAGAAEVHAFDNNDAFVAEAQKNAFKVSAMRAGYGDLNRGLPAWCRPPYDIVLALAVLHKVRDVPAAVRAVANACSGLLVVRLPFGSTGVLRAKHADSTCDLMVQMPALGFRLDVVEEGPRGERVQHWWRWASVTT